MKWFKHDADCISSEGLSYLLYKEGFAGYGRWFRLLEIVAAKMDGTDRCHAEYPIQKWCSLLGLKQKKLSSFLKLTENKLKTKVVCFDNIIRIEVPNLLEKRDEYSKRSGQNHDNIRYKKKEERDKIKEREKDINTYRTNKNVKNIIFKPPSLEEVTLYCRERKNQVDPEKWHNYYTSNGWMVGKNKMKDWKAAVRTWEKSDYGTKGNSQAGNGIPEYRTEIPIETTESREHGKRVLAAIRQRIEKNTA